MKQALALAGVLALTVLSGCLNSGPEEQSINGVAAVGASDMMQGTYYQFNHRGGALIFAAGEYTSATFDLYDGQDSRIGRIELGPGGFANEIKLDEDRGDFVLYLVNLANTPHAHSDENASAPEPELTVRSSGSKVQQFIPLGEHFERHPLVSRAIQNVDQTGLGPITESINQNNGEPLEETILLDLHRTPGSLRVLVAGGADNLQMRIRGTAGLLMDLDESYSNPWPQLMRLDGQFYPENARDGALIIDLSADAQNGPIILESWSYSRYLPSGNDEAKISDVVAPSLGVTFTYGQLGDAPIAIELSQKANWLYAWTENSVPDEGVDPDCEPGEPCSGSFEEPAPIVAAVAIYDSEDVKLGTFTVKSGQRLEIPVSGGGKYVAVLKDGPIYLGTDVAPRDFEMHPLATNMERLGGVPGETTSYGQVKGNVSAVGIPYGVDIWMEEPNQNNNFPIIFGGDCSDFGTIRLLAGGETIGYWGDGVPNTLGLADYVVASSGLEYIQDGFDGNCGQAQLAIMTYQR